ncbi:hypothetical protein BDF19DRAFT_426290 [Syncephalis fuscata]|nr:hypothetical protein BDF19DRAFT_426290 [Syncephalis fuscata]
MLSSTIIKTMMFMACSAFLAVGAVPFDASYGRSRVSVEGGKLCGIIDDIYYSCDAESNSVCATMPGRSQSICVKVSIQGSPCDNDYTMCANGLTCSIQNGRLDGICMAL